MDNLIANLLDAGLSSVDANKIIERLNHHSTLTPELCWQEIIKNIFDKAYPFSVHQLLYQIIYPQWQEIPAPIWFPDRAFAASTNTGKIMAEGKFNNYGLLNRWTTTMPEEFWGTAAKLLTIQFDKEATTTLDISNGVEKPSWFPGSKLNIVNSCFQANPANLAIIEDTPQGIKKITYYELAQRVDQIAFALRDKVKQKEKIGLALPMSADAIAVFLAIIKVGCCAVPLDESLSTNAIAEYLRAQNINIVFSKNQPIYDKNVLKNDTSFTAISCMPDTAACVLNTDEKMLIPWTHITPIKCGADAYFHLNVQPNDILCMPAKLSSTLGIWTIFASLLNKAAIALYHGPENAFIKFISTAKITILGIDETLSHQWRANDALEKNDFSAVRLFVATSKYTDVEDMFYLAAQTGYKPIIHYYCQADLAGAYVTSTLLQPIAPGADNASTLGLSFVIIDKNGAPAIDGESALLPPAIGLSTEILNKDNYQIYYANMPKYIGDQCIRRKGDHIKRFTNGFYRLLRNN